VVPPIRGVLISVVAVILQYTNPAGEIIPVCVLRWASTRGELRSLHRLKEWRRNSNADRARAGAFAGVSAMHPMFLCVASFSLMVGAAAWRARCHD
jgi:hypothetical protein